MCRYLFDAEVGYTEDATAHLQQDGVAAVLQAMADELPTAPLASSDDAKALIKQVTKAAGVKKGLVMKSLRAGLTCALKGPDLVESWLLLHQKGLDGTRLSKAIAIGQA